MRKKLEQISHSSQNYVYLLDLLENSYPHSPLKFNFLFSIADYVFMVDP